MTEEGVSTPPAALVPVGEIVGTHGVGGLLRLHPYGDSTAALAANQTVYLTGQSGDAASADTAQPVCIASARPHGRIVLVRIAGVDSIEAAEPFVGRRVSVDEHDLPAAAPGEIYAYKLNGLAVATTDGRPVGTVAETFATGANEVLVVRDGDREHLIPLIADVVRTVDIDAGRIVIDPIPGLLD
jgi:16S rRNA processing protein RimM